MKLLGILIILSGWGIAASSVTLSSTGAQLALAVLGIAVSLGGLIGVLNRAHLRNAIWKS